MQTIRLKKGIHQTPELVLKELAIDGLALFRVKEKNFENSLVAVKQNGLALQFIPKDLSKEEVKTLRREAVRQNGLAIKFIPKSERTAEERLLAVSQNGLALRFIEHEEQTDEEIDASLKQNPYSLQYVDFERRTLERSFDAVNRNPHTYQYVLPTHSFDVYFS